jgi:hypothetical protein
MGYNEIMIPYFELVDFHIGTWVIRTWGVFVAVAFLVGLWLVEREAKQRGLSAERMIDMTIWIIIAAMIGAKKGMGCSSFFIGIFLGPFGILIALLSKGNRQTCLYCSELVHQDAAICKHCGKSLAVRATYTKPPWDVRG